MLSIFIINYLFTIQDKIYVSAKDECRKLIFSNIEKKMCMRFETRINVKIYNVNKMIERKTPKPRRFYDN